MVKIWRIYLPILGGVMVGVAIGLSWADSRYPDLRSGSTYGQVFSHWGDPKEKVERGLKGETVWYYPSGGFVVFRRGKVVQWRSPFGASSVAEQPTLTETVSAVATEPIDSLTRDLVRDIAREVPSGPDVPYSEPPPPLQVQPSSQPADGMLQPVPQPPPGIAPGNPVVPFGDDIGED
jgi:hypothetical protein